MVTSMAFLAWWWQTNKQPGDLSASLLLTITMGRRSFAKSELSKRVAFSKMDVKGNISFSIMNKGSISIATYLTLSHTFVYFLQTYSTLAISISSAIMLDQKGAYLWLQFCHIFDPLIPLLTLCPLPSHHFGYFANSQNLTFANMTT